MNIRQQDHSETGSMYCIIKFIVQGKQARVKNANLRHPSSMCQYEGCGTLINTIRMKKQEILSLLTRKNVENHAPLSPKMHYFLLATLFQPTKV